MLTMNDQIRETFKTAIFTVIECINRYELSQTGQKLVVHYFNESSEHNAYSRAIAAVEKYLSEKIPQDYERSPELIKLLSELEYLARLWDEE